MTIPEIRAWLRGIANSVEIKGCLDEARGIRIAVEELKRRPAIRMAGVKAQTVTPVLRGRLRAYAAAHPDVPYREIGRLFGVDGGRVSEALAGFRK